MTRRTFQPKAAKRMRKIGFLTRMKTSGGRAMIQRRRNKGRKKLAG